MIKNRQAWVKLAIGRNYDRFKYYMRVKHILIFIIYHFKVTVKGRQPNLIYPTTNQQTLKQLTFLNMWEMFHVYFHRNYDRFKYYMRVSKLIKRKQYKSNNIN
jgi:hypothetical protein